MRLLHFPWLLILWLNVDESFQQTAVKCAEPEIENGFVLGGIQEYKENQVLEFRCNTHYESTERRPTKCVKVGERAEWSPTPLCTPIRCKLELTPPKETTYETAGRNLFSPGDTTTVTCGERYGISHLQSRSAETTCQEDGQWTITPACREVTCSHLRDPLVSSSWRQQSTLDQTISYSCVRGYRRTNGVNWATCTRSGWTPNPLCEVTTCKTKQYSNADIVGDFQPEYSDSAQVKYTCKDGYEGTFTLTCRNSDWILSGQCREAGCEKLEIDGADITINNKARYNSNDRVTYTCRNGVEDPFTATCKMGVWTDIQNCTVFQSCESPPPLEGGDITYTMKSNYSHNEKVEYLCQSYYTMEGEPYRTCINGEWAGHMRCLEPCIVNEDNMTQHNILLKSSNSPKYLAHDEVIDFRCARGVPVGAVAMRQRCNGGVLLLPTCQ